MILEAVLLGLFAASAEQADSEKTTYSYFTQGKQAVRREYSKTEQPARPERAELSSPDAYAYKSVGKQVERVMARDLAPSASTSAPESRSKDSYSYVTVGKRPERRAVTSEGP
jgi:hypothetical protein